MASHKGTQGGWVKYPGNPVLGGELGVCFDISMLRENGVYRMWFSWRTKKSVALTESEDGIHWSEPVICLSPTDSGWEEEINRCSVVHQNGRYYMWYTGQIWEGRRESCIGLAVSGDGVTWERVRKEPVLRPELSWEKEAIMCPHVLWDEGAKQFKMWFSAGEQYEPNAIGYAVSRDGINWERYPQNPIFQADPGRTWEQHKCTACQVLYHGGWHYMFYIGFENEDYAQIGLARSKDGITSWERSGLNPLIAPDEGSWDGNACYKPFVLYDPDSRRWMLWYNGRRGSIEQIGLAFCEGENFLF